MKLLAIDTANWPLGIAIQEEGRLLGEVNTQMNKNHSLRLMPTVEWLCEQVGVKPNQLDGIAVAKGPGSYTGVRIGVTTAKVLAWSLKIPLIGLSSLQVVAQNRSDFGGLLIPLFDARRGQVYTGTYRKQDGQDIATAQGEDRLVLVENLCKELLNTDQPLLFLGEGVRVHQDQIRSILKEKAEFAPEVDHPPRAGQLANLAYRLWNEKIEQGDELHRFAPEYLQLAEAEANLLKNKGNG